MTSSIQSPTPGKEKLPKTIDEAVELMKKFLAVHIESTEPMDQYFKGMANGMIFSISLLDGEEPIYASDRAAITPPTPVGAGEKRVPLISDSGRLDCQTDPEEFEKSAEWIVKFAKESAGAGEKKTRTWAKIALEKDAEWRRFFDGSFQTFFRTILDGRAGLSELKKKVEGIVCDMLEVEITSLEMSNDIVEKEFAEKRSLQKDTDHAWYKEQLGAIRLQARHEAFGEMKKMIEDGEMPSFTCLGQNHSGKKGWEECWKYMLSRLEEVAGRDGR